jgi:hypothetical protein
VKSCSLWKDDGWVIVGGKGCGGVCEPSVVANQVLQIPGFDGGGVQVRGTTDAIAPFLDDSLT